MRPSERLPALPGVVAVLALFLTACSSAPQPAGTGEAPKPVRVLVLPVEADPAMDTSDVPAAAPAAASGAATAAQREQGVERVTRDLTRETAAQLAARPRYAVVAPRAGAGLAVAPDATPDPAAVRRVAAGTCAEAVLRIRLSGYGHLNRTWSRRVIASGSVEAAGEGTVAWLATGSGPVGVAVMLEEGVRDTLMAFGGLAAFNSNYEPVTLNGELFDARTGRLLWSDTALATANAAPPAPASKAHPPKVRGQRAALRLAGTGRRAVGKLLDSLGEAPLPAPATAPCSATPPPVADGAADPRPAAAAVP